MQFYPVSLFFLSCLRIFLSLCSSASVGDQVRHQSKTVGKTMIPYALNNTFKQSAECQYMDFYPSVTPKTSTSTNTAGVVKPLMCLSTVTVACCLQTPSPLLPLQVVIVTERHWSLVGAVPCCTHTYTGLLQFCVCVCWSPF